MAEAAIKSMVAVGEHPELMERLRDVAVSTTMDLLEEDR